MIRCLVSQATLSLLLLTLASGCGPSLGTKQAITGRVTFKGQPLSQGTIQFMPKAGTTGTFSGSEIKDGRYEVPRESGLDPGTYEVRISSPEAPAAGVTDAPGEAGPVAKELIPPEYNSETKLEYIVNEGQANEFNVDIP